MDRRLFLVTVLGALFGSRVASWLKQWSFPIATPIQASEAFSVFGMRLCFSEDILCADLLSLVSNWKCTASVSDAKTLIRQTAPALLDTPSPAWSGRVHRPRRAVIIADDRETIVVPRLRCTGQGRFEWKLHSATPPQFQPVRDLLRSANI
jgi:hypothetical protein